MFLNITKNHIFSCLMAVVVGISMFPFLALAQMPFAYTYEPVNVGANSATFVGYVNPLGTYDTERWFEWGTSPSLPLPQITEKAQHGPDKGEFIWSAGGLSSDTVYFYRVAARNSSGTSYGKVLSFRTAAGTSKQPIVTTQSVLHVESDQASVSCFVDTQGNPGVLGWVEWGKNTGASQNASLKEYRSGTYSVTLSGLSQNTAYYYRCAAKSDASPSVYGSVVSFYTPSVSIIPIQPPYTGGSLSLSTKLATEIQDASARLNAVVLPGSASQVYGWFEWGSTPSLGNSSVRRYIGSGSLVVLSDTVTGLIPGTTYFFKPVTESTQGRTEGLIFTFRTTGISPFPTPAPTPAPAPYPVKKPIVTKTIPKTGSTAISKEERPVSIEIIPSTDTVAQKERFYEMVEVTNTTNETISNVAVRIILPNETSYLSTGGNDFTENGKTIHYTVGEMDAKERIRLLFWQEVGSGVADKTSLETIAIATWGDNINLRETQSVGRVIVTVDASRVVKNGGMAAAVSQSVSSDESDAGSSKGSFSGLKGWSMVIGIALLLFGVYLFFVSWGKDNSDKEREEDMLNEEEAGDPFITNQNDTKKNTTPLVVPIAPTQRGFTAKAAPPENLPV